MMLKFTADLTAASWLQEEIREFGSGVRGLLPNRFEHYARVLHPAFDDKFEQVKWCDIASWSGRTMHPQVQFESVAKPRTSFGLEPKPWSSEPNDGGPPGEVLAPLRKVLARHTETADRCWFCLWEGWGHLNDGASGVIVIGAPGETNEQATERLGVWNGAAIPSSIQTQAKVGLPGRDYLLLEGPLEAIVDPEMVAGASDEGHPGVEFVSQAPSIFWPEDRSWCVASEIDLDSTYIGGSAELIAEILDEPFLEAVPASLDDRVDWGADAINAG